MLENLKKTVLSAALMSLLALTVWVAVVEPIKFALWVSLVVTPILMFNHNAKSPG